MSQARYNRQMLVARALLCAGAAALINCSSMPASRFVRADYDAGGSFTNTLIAADFNGDGTMDLEASNSSSINIGILLGVGDGTFGTAVPHDVVGQPGGAAAGDFNGDGVADLAVPNLSSKTSTVGHTVSMFVGSPNGLVDAPGWTVDGVPASAASADIDGDGRMDVVIVHWTNEVSAWLGNGDGTFRSSWTMHPTGVDVYRVAIADLDGDGKLDIALAGEDPNLSGGGSVTTCLGNGDGTFGGPRTFAAGFNVDSIAVADFNRDGHPDVAVVNLDNGQRTGYAAVLLGNGDGTLRMPRLYETAWGASAVAAGDFNGDGRADLVVADNYASDISVLLGRGDGTFQAAAHYTSTFGVRALAVADLNRDGAVDFAVAVAQSNMVSVFLNAP